MVTFATNLHEHSPGKYSDWRATESSSKSGWPPRGRRATPWDRSPQNIQKPKMRITHLKTIFTCCCKYGLMAIFTYPDLLNKAASLSMFVWMCVLILYRNQILSANFEFIIFLDSPCNSAANKPNLGSNRCTHIKKMRRDFQIFLVVKKCVSVPNVYNCSIFLLYLYLSVPAFRPPTP